MAIVYQHRRKDTNEVFYIGIGKDIARPYIKQHRNIHWHRIVNKCGYEVDILINGCSYQEAKEIEVGMIKDLGRRDLNTGHLVNMTNGGEGILGYIVTQEIKNALSKSAIIRFSKKEEREKTSESTKLAMKRPEVVLATSKAQIKRFAKEENRQKTSESTKLAMKRPDVRKKVLETNKRIGLIIASLKTMYKETKEKRVPQSEIEKYTIEGWTLGRCPNFKLGRKKGNI
jgi:hypothetical protein